MITVIGIFKHPGLAEEASSYLLANAFENENIDTYTNGTSNSDSSRVDGFFGHLVDDETDAAHYASLALKGTVITVHAKCVREAQEAADVFDQYGAVQVKASNDETIDANTRSVVINQVVDENKRLR